MFSTSSSNCCPGRSEGVWKKNPLPLEGENALCPAWGFCLEMAPTLQEVSFPYSLVPWTPDSVVFFFPVSFQFLLNEMGGCWVLDWHLVCTACIHLPEKGLCTMRDCQRQPGWHFWEPRQLSQQLRSPPQWKETSSGTIMEGGVISQAIKIFLRFLSPIKPLYFLSTYSPTTFQDT